MQIGWEEEWEAEKYFLLVLEGLNFALYCFWVSLFFAKT